MRHVLFVCVENSCRSQMAEAFGQMHKPSGVAVHSSGSRPSGQVNPKAVQAMAEAGYDLTAHYSKGLTEVPDTEYDVIVTMGCGDSCPHIKAKSREDWALPDPKHMDTQRFNHIRYQIEHRVKTLLARF